MSVFFSGYLYGTRVKLSKTHKFALFRMCLVAKSQEEGWMQLNANRRPLPQ